MANRTIINNSPDSDPGPRETYVRDSSAASANTAWTVAVIALMGILFIAFLLLFRTDNALPGVPNTAVDVETGSTDLNDSAAVPQSNPAPQSSETNTTIIVPVPTDPQTSTTTR